MTKLVLSLGLVVILHLAAIGQNLDYINSTLWTGICDIKVMSNYAYCALFNGLMILDISNPDTPRFVSQYYIGGDWKDYERRAGQKLAVLGNYVYFAADYKGMQIINVSNPANPTLASIYTTLSYVSDVFVVDTLAYVACQSSYLDILNVADKANPFLIGHCPVTGNCWGVYVQGNYAYAADDVGGLQVVDVTDPTNPVVVGNFNQYDYALDVVASGNYAYMAYGHSGLIIADISNPTDPTYVGGWSNPGNIWAEGVYVYGNYAYLAVADGVKIIDVTDPHHPTISGSIATDWAIDVFVTGDYAYEGGVPDANDDPTGLRVINISNPFNPALAGIYSTPRIVNDLMVSGHYAYVTCGTSGLNIVNIADPTNPQVVGNWQPGESEDPARLAAVSVYGHYAFLADQYLPSLRIINIRWLPPSSVGEYELSASPSDVFVREPYAFVTTENGFVIINVNNPTNPTLVSYHNIPNGSIALVVSGNYAYIAGTYEFQILNISNPSSPSVVGSYADGYVSGIEVSGNYVYLIVDGQNLDVVDISSPGHPIRVGQQRTGGSAQTVRVMGNYAFVSEARSIACTQGMEVFDITDKTNPVLVDSIKTPGNGAQFTLTNDGRIYLADNYSLMILHSGLIVNIEDNRVPVDFSLSQNYPNPFNAQTTIQYDLIKDSPVNIGIYDILGQRIETLVNQKQPAGHHQVIWNAGNVSSGVYFYKINAGEYSETKKMVLLK
jgi:hypothetical protein